MSAILPALPRSAFTSARLSIDMANKYNLFQRKPPGASCNWVKEELTTGAPYRRWGLDPCAKVNISIYINAIFAPQASFVALVGFTLGGASSPCYRTNTGFLESGVPGSYLSCVGSRLILNIWTALADGAWASSIAITVRTSYRPNSSSDPMDVRAGPVSNLDSPAFKNALNPVSGSGAASCTVDTIDNTLTVYDDGNFIWT
jgi:hypothetical protein